MLEHTFNSQQIDWFKHGSALNRMKAVAAASIEIKTPRFCKKVQVDPYLEDTLCSLCSMKQGPYFCR